MSYFPQDQEYPTRVLHVPSERVLSAGAGATLPALAQVYDGAEPSGYIDHGMIKDGIVQIAVEHSSDSIDGGRIATPFRYFLTARKGSAKYEMQEYQPESVNIAASYASDNVPESGSGYKRVRIGRGVQILRRLLILGCFDVNKSEDASEPWTQYWHTTPTAQGMGGYSSAQNKLANTVPHEYMFLAYSSGAQNYLLDFYALST